MRIAGALLGSLCENSELLLLKLRAALVLEREEPGAMTSGIVPRCTPIDVKELHYPAMSDPNASFLQFLKGQEICQIAFGMYDLQINWGNGGLSCTGRLLYEPSEGAGVVWTEGHPFDAVPVLRLLQQTVEEFDNPVEGVLTLQFSNGDRLTVARESGPEAFTIHHTGKPIIVG